MRWRTRSVRRRLRKPAPVHVAAEKPDAAMRIAHSTHGLFLSWSPPIRAAADHDVNVPCASISTDDENA